MKKVVVFVVLAMVVIGSLAAQSTNDAQKFVGTWVVERGSRTFVLNANGTGTLTSSNGETKNIFWGISASGELYITGYSSLGSYYSNGYFKYFLSPDGKRMIYWDDVYQKK